MPRWEVTAVLELSHVSKDYPTARGPLPILSGIDLNLARGEAIAIMGPSGSGKSTLLYLIGGLEPPTAGTITLDGRNPYQLSEPELAVFRHRNVGFVFQDHYLLPQCTVLENVLIPTLVAPASSIDYRARAIALLERVGLAERLDHRPAELSGGEKQRVAIARALIAEPPLLLCDEPTGNLDQDSAEKVAALLLELHAQLRTILIVVTHSAELAARLPRCYRMQQRTLTLA
jgi:lipoprotein-releasing system ATP-binding protein